jgi:transmembrane sensor
MSYLPRKIDSLLMLKVIRGHASQEEREFLDAWLKESDGNKEEYAAIAEIWERSGRTGTPVLPDPQRQWENIQARLHPIREHNSGRMSDRAAHRPERPGVRPRVSLYAASVSMLLFTVVVGLTIGIFWLANRSRQAGPDPVLPSATASFEREYTTTNGRRALIPLPDGTVVHLNAASRLRIAAGFGNTERKVLLEGEAYFAVAPDASRPFRVFTGASFTEVRGTEFGVRFRREKLEVVVSRGKVRVVTPRQGGSVDLVRGEGVTASAAGDLSKPRRVDLRESLAWRENRLAFKKTSLEEVMAEIEEVYDLHVEFRNGAARERTLTGNFSVDSVDEVLSQIALAMDVSIHREGRNVVVR